MNQAVPNPPLGTRVRQIAVRLALSVVVFVVALEIGLRLIGFEHRRYIARLRDNEAQADIAAFNADPYTIWAPVADTGPFNGQGFIGPELSRERTPGTVRIACLGDSCTQFGSPAYPARVARLLEERGRTNVEVMNWGVAGYSSFQGLARLRHDVLAYRPDIVTIYFGWNDHWVRAGLPDDVASLRVGRAGPVMRAVQEARVVQAAEYAVEIFRRPRRSIQFRVSLDAYRDNLRTMISEIRDAGGRVLLITAPDCLGNDAPIQNHLDGLTSLGYSNAVTLHADYVAATREVAAEQNAALLDAARHFADEISGCDYFLPDRDPVHMTDPGLDVLAKLLVDRLVREGWFE